MDMKGHKPDKHVQAKNKGGRICCPSMLIAFKWHFQITSSDGAFPRQALLTCWSEDHESSGLTPNPEESQLQQHGPALLPTSGQSSHICPSDSHPCPGCAQPSCGKSCARGQIIKLIEHDTISVANHLMERVLPGNILVHAQISELPQGELCFVHACCWWGDRRSQGGFACQRYQKARYHRCFHNLAWPWSVSDQIPSSHMAAGLAAPTVRSQCQDEAAEHTM